MCGCCCGATLEKCRTKVKPVGKAYRKDKDTDGPCSVYATRILDGICDKVEIMHGECVGSLARVLTKLLPLHERVATWGRMHIHEKATV